MAKGESIGCFALSEPHGGSDPSQMRTRARRDGGDWILNGSKIWITNGSMAHVALVWADTDEASQRFFEKGMRGFRTRDREQAVAARFDHVVAFLRRRRVPAANVLPGANGLGAALTLLTQGRHGIARGAIGAAQACFAEVLEYTTSRVLFGRPLAHTQSIQMRLADMARRITTAQLLALRLGRLNEAKAMRPVHASLAKWNNVRMALDVARDCRDMLGAAGITAEHVAIRHMLNLESVITYEGTETVHELVVGKELTGVGAF